MLKIDNATIEKISDDIVDYIKSQGKSLYITPKAGGGSNESEYLESLWYNYIKRVDPHEKQYIVIIKSLLTRQANEVFDNIKKYLEYNCVFLYENTSSLVKSTGIGN